MRNHAQKNLYGMLGHLTVSPQYLTLAFNHVVTRAVIKWVPNITGRVARHKGSLVVIPLGHPVDLPVLSGAAVNIDLSRLGVLNGVTGFEASACTSLKDFEESTTDLERCADRYGVCFTGGDSVRTAAGEAGANLLAEAGSFDSVTQDLEIERLAQVLVRGLWGLHWVLTSPSACRRCLDGGLY